MQQEVQPERCTSQFGNEVDCHDDDPLRTARLFWEKRRLLLIIVLGGTTLFQLISLLVPSSYEAKTELMPPELPSDITFKVLRRLGTSGTDRPGLQAGQPPEC